MEEKTNIQKVVDLLEANGFHVFKAEEILPNWLTGKVNNQGAISLLIAPYKEKEKC